MKILSVFNNKGGVGKTTLTYHLAHALSASGKKVLLIDADPQCNLTIYSMQIEAIQEIWEAEDVFLEIGVEDFKKNNTNGEIDALLSKPRSLHFLVKATIDGQDDFPKLPPTVRIHKNLQIIPGRLSIHAFEEKISTRWSDVYRGDSLAIRTITKIRNLAEEYGRKFKYDYVIIDTSPSLGALNKTIISTVDGFFVPAAPDMFSLYGIKNIGSSLEKWKEEFEIIFKILSKEKRALFPADFVKFLGYTIYNARKYDRSAASDKWKLARAHLNYAEKIPDVIKDNIDKKFYKKIPLSVISEPIGGDSIMYTHNTFPTLAQHYRVPMWDIPAQKIDADHQNTINGQRGDIILTRDKYISFSQDLISRIT